MTFEKFWERYENEFDWDENDHVMLAAKDAWHTALAQHNIGVQAPAAQPNAPDVSGVLDVETGAAPAGEGRVCVPCELVGTGDEIKCRVHGQAHLQVTCIPDECEHCDHVHLHEQCWAEIPEHNGERDRCMCYNRAAVKRES